MGSSILERIKVEITKQMNLDDVNRIFKERAELGVAAAITSKDNANLKTGKASKARMGKHKFGLASKTLKSKTSYRSNFSLQKIVLKLNKQAIK